MTGGCEALAELCRLSGQFSGYRIVSGYPPHMTTDHPTCTNAVQEKPGIMGQSGLEILQVIFGYLFDKYYRLYSRSAGDMFTFILITICMFNILLFYNQKIGYTHSN